MLVEVALVIIVTGEGVSGAARVDYPPTLSLNKIEGHPDGGMVLAIEVLVSESDHLPH